MCSVRFSNMSGLVDALQFDLSATSVVVRHAWLILW